MTAAEFDAYSRGKTLHFGSGGTIYGAEEYLPNRRVRWSFLDGRCQEGEWYEQGNLICFTYDLEPEPQCWSFYHSSNGLTAIFKDDPTNSTLFEIQEQSKPLICLGPEIGV